MTPTRFLFITTLLFSLSLRAQDNVTVILGGGNDSLHFADTLPPEEKPMYWGYPSAPEMAFRFHRVFKNVNRDSLVSENEVAKAETPRQRSLLLGACFFDISVLIAEKNNKAAVAKFPLVEKLMDELLAPVPPDVSKRFRKNKSNADSLMLILADLEYHFDEIMTYNDRGECVYLLSVGSTTEAAWLACRTPALSPEKEADFMNEFGMTLRFLVQGGKSDNYYPEIITSIIRVFVLLPVTSKDISTLQANRAALLRTTRVIRQSMTAG